jgi:ABC-type dipeptide/oligopeptide/nickel transport system permease subunit
MIKKLRTSNTVMLVVEGLLMGVVAQQSAHRKLWPLVAAMLALFICTIARALREEILTKVLEKEKEKFDNVKDWR